MKKYYASEDVLGEFYKSLNNHTRVHIPRSDVFYVRLAIYNRTNEWFSLSHVEKAMMEEGYLDKKDILT